MALLRRIVLVVLSVFFIYNAFRLKEISNSRSMLVARILNLAVAVVLVLMAIFEGS